MISLRRPSREARLPAGWLCALWLACGGVMQPRPVLAAACQLGRFAEFAVTMTDSKPMMTAKINGVDVHFVVDSGAFFSSISAASAAELKLGTYPLPMGFQVKGATGAASMSLARVKELTLVGVPLHNIEFLVGGGEVGGHGVGLLGQNILHIGDVEYDLGRGAVRLMKAEDCGKAVLAYWVTAGAPYSVMAMETSDTTTQGWLPNKTSRLGHTLGTAYVNGSAVRVMFDTGAPRSILSLKAAARIGITPDSPGVKAAGAAWGIGTKMVQSYIAPFSSFKLGSEEIQHTRLRIAEIDLPNADMLIGADFFLSHHIYVANSQNKLYFTYNGGPVFNLSGDNPTSASSTAASASSRATSASSAAAPDAAIQAADSAVDPAEYSRRGAAEASRGNLSEALADFGHACELAPDHADYFRQRGLVYWRAGRATEALADFDEALALTPDDVGTLASRAGLRLQMGEKASAVTDLDAADRVASQQADTRLSLGQLYERADRLPAAVAQYSLWIDAHAEDARLAMALRSRCWARALDGRELAPALKDCNAALKHTDKAGELHRHILEGRALVYLRMGDYDKSIADYDASLANTPKAAWPLYGRGVDRLRKHDRAGGDADIAQAVALLPTIAEEFSRHGIQP